MLEILQDPDSRLREIATAVGEVTPDVLEFCTELLTTLTHGTRDGSIGLAATQVGICKRVFVMLEHTKKRGLRRHTFIDPVITKKTGEVVFAEGCLSFPAKSYVRVPRASAVWLEWTDREGHRRREVFQGLYAVCVQHELDHLDGKLMTDYGELVTRETDPTLKSP